MNIKEEIFRAYDIRGIYKKDLNEEIAEIIGKAFGTFIGENKKIVIGRDVRISSENLEKSFINGLLKTGCQVIPIGLIHTPLLYFVIIHYSLDGGVMITASVDYNEYTLVKDLKSNQTKLVKIGEFIEDNHDKFKNFAVLAFNPENGRVSFQKIEEVYKHKINEPLYELILEHGRRVKVTASHSVFTFRDNKLISLPTSQLKIGDLIPVINYIPNNPHIPEINIVKEIWPYRNELRKIILTGKDIIKINLLRSRKQKKQRVKLKIEGKKFLRDLREKLGLTRKEVAKHSGLSMMSIQRIELLQKREFIKRTTLEKYLKFLGLDTKEFLTNFASNIDYFEQMLKDGKTFNYLELQKLKKEDLKNIKECYLHGYGYPNNPIKNLIRVTPELVKLIGYYLAEGNLECEDRVTFTLGPLKKGHEKLIAKEIIFSCKRVFGITPKIYRYKSKTKLVIDNVVVYSLFAKVFKFEKKNSNTKTLPDFVYTLPKELILELLRCIFLGDGTIMKDGIKFSSASEELAIGISYLLSMLSVNFSFNKKESKKNRKNLFEIYVGKNDLGKIKKIWKDHYRAKQLSLKVKKSHKEFKLNDLLLLPLKEIRRVSPSSEYVYDFSVKSGTFIAGIGICCHNSHNPPEWNGFKLCKEKAILCGQGMGMEEIKSIAFSKKFNISNKGKIIKKENIMDDYKKFILSKIEIEKGLRIGIDPGNGSCSIIAKKILEEKGLEVFSINDFPDGRFPAHLPEPTEENLKELQELVIEKNLDFGAGFDGDGDRAVFIDD
ncbi:MAG: helix-turn-helix domain-containing protein, partial [Nitrososphaerota archaeon]